MVVVLFVFFALVGLALSWPDILNDHFDTKYMINEIKRLDNERDSLYDSDDCY